MNITTCQLVQWSTHNDQLVSSRHTVTVGTVEVCCTKRGLINQSESGGG